MVTLLIPVLKVLIGLVKTHEKKHLSSLHQVPELKSPRPSMLGNSSVTNTHRLQFPERSKYRVGKGYFVWLK